MNPIDQIRKALEAWESNKQPSTDAALLRALSPDAIKALLTSHDAAVQRAAEMERERDSFRASMGEWAERFEASQANAAKLLQRAKTAEGRAAEMQERCAQVCEARADSAKKVQSEPEANRSFWDGAILATQACAAAIRAIKE